MCFEKYARLKQTFGDEEATCKTSVQLVDLKVTVQSESVLGLTHASGERTQQPD